MKKANNINFDLVQGDFSKEEAKEILMNLINEKIKFHSLIMFSNDIRTGKKDLISKKRIEKLNEIKSELLDLFNENSEFKNVKIDGEIKIELS